MLGVLGEGGATLHASGRHAGGGIIDERDRHFCAGTMDDAESCLTKALDLLDMALEASHHDLGLEWRLAPGEKR